MDSTNPTVIHICAIFTYSPQNGYHQYLSLEQNPLCKDEPKYSQAWYLQNCDKFQGSNNLNIKLANKAFSSTNITYHANPNRDTLIYYLWKYSYRDRGSHLKEFKSTNSSYDFKFNLIEDKFLKKQMKTKGILSYLYYQDGEVLIDEFSPKERLGEFLNNKTKLFDAAFQHYHFKAIVNYENVTLSFFNWLLNVYGLSPRQNVCVLFYFVFV